MTELNQVPLTIGSTSSFDIAIHRYPSYISSKNIDNINP